MGPASTLLSTRKPTLASTQRRIFAVTGQNATGMAADSHHAAVTAAPGTDDDMCSVFVLAKIGPNFGKCDPHLVL
jgi:hypothetical protein